MYRAQFLLLGLALALPLTACRDRGAAVRESRAPLSRDSAGVRIVTSYEPRWRPGEEWTVSAEPVLRIGMVDGPQAYLFDRIEGVTRLSDGTIVVLNSGDGQVRYFAPDGKHLRSVGREGRGPGEMRAGRWLDRIENDVVQVTHSDGRLQYAPDGTLVGDDRLRWERIHEISRAARIEGSPGFLMESCSPDTPLFLGDAVLLCTTTYGDVRYTPEREGVYQRVMFVARSDWTLETLDTIGIFPYGAFAIYRSGGRPHRAGFEPPYGPRGRMGVSGSPPRLVYTNATAYRIELHAIDGPRRTMVIERAGGMRAPTEQEMSSFDRAFEANPRMRKAGGNPGSFRGQVVVADSVSIIASAPHVDAVGAVWAPLDAAQDATHRMYDVFDADGSYLGQVRVPRSRFRLREIGADYILGVTTDDLGVEYVTMYRLDRTVRH
jgi:hypothetical protein